MDKKQHEYRSREPLVSMGIGSSYGGCSSCSQLILSLPFRLLLYAVFNCHSTEVSHWRNLGSAGHSTSADSVGVERWETNEEKREREAKVPQPMPSL